MKRLKLLSNFKVIFFTAILYISSTIIIFANDPVDIWNLEKEETKVKGDNEVNLKNDISKKENSNYEIVTDNILSENELNFSNSRLVGIYDPKDHSLKIDMWSNSNGDQIKSILKKISSSKLSEDAEEILEIALLTNSYTPKNQITFDEFNRYKFDFLIKKKDFELTKKFLTINKNIPNSQKLIKNYLDHYLLKGELEKSCELFEEVKILETDDYIDKFYIYCLISKEEKDGAQIIYDLKKETGFNDNFFEEKFNFLMGYSDEVKTNSEENILDFHLSHKTDNNFSYTPDSKTKKFIWRYLSKNNLLEQVYDIDLDDGQKIQTIEKATHEKNYAEDDLLNLYKRFDFSLDNLLNVKNIYNTLPSYKARALLYQRLLLTYSVQEKLYFAEKIKSSMIKDKIDNAYNVELSNMLNSLDSSLIPSEYSKFYSTYLIPNEQKKKKIKFNNKIIHQSKLINYFIKKYEVEKLSKETNDFLKKIKANKAYVFSNKDKILLDSIKSDGAEIKKKYENLYVSDPNVPTDLQVLINNNEIGMILLRLVEIIGEDKLESLGTEDLYFITSVLNQTDLDIIRDKILIKILPQRV